LQYARMPEGCDVAALLQFEPDLIDAARRIDREHELQIDGGLRRRPSGDGKQDEQRPPDGAPDPSALTMGVKAGVHCCRLNMSCLVAARFTTITVTRWIFISNFECLEAIEVGDGGRRGQTEVAMKAAR
jgi:hypothetical protein